MKESLPTFEAFHQSKRYVQEKHVDLATDYRNKDGIESCSLIAFEVAEILRQEGGNPEILSLRGRKIDGINTAGLVPRQYHGRVSWGGHVVCANEGLIYDPMVGEVLPEKEYLLTVFEEPVEVLKRKLYSDF